MIRHTCPIWEIFNFGKKHFCFEMPVKNLINDSNRCFLNVILACVTISYFTILFTIPTNVFEINAWY